MIDTNGFHLPTVDVFDCSKGHSMTSSHFVEWMKKSAFRLREDSGKMFSEYKYRNIWFLHEVLVVE